MIKVALFGIAGVLLVLPLRRERGEYATLLAMAVGMVIFSLVLVKIEAVLDFADELMALVPVDRSYLILVMKMIGITYVAEFASELCADAGCAAIGRQVELFARIFILTVSIPVLTMFVEAIDSFL